MSNQKKRIIMLAVLLVALLVTAVIDKEISILEYICIFANAGAYLGLVFASQTLIEDQQRRILGQSGMIFRLMTRGGRYNLMNEVEALPKVASATGQIYVDYEDVMQILKGDEIVER